MVVGVAIDCRREEPSAANRVSRAAAIEAMFAAADRRAVPPMNGGRDDRFRFERAEISTSKPGIFEVSRGSFAYVITRRSRRRESFRREFTAGIAGCGKRSMRQGGRERGRRRR